VTRDTDRCTAVCNTGGENANVTSFVPSSQPELVILAVNGNVLHMLMGELLNSIINEFPSTRLAHGLCRVVRVTSGTVPITSQRLGVEGDFYTPLFGDADEEEASHPQMVAHGDALAWTDLELPLGRHDLGVDSGNVDTGI
jgi:hypothetical protein